MNDEIPHTALYFRRLAKTDFSTLSTPFGHSRRPLPGQTQDASNKPRAHVPVRQGRCKRWSLEARLAEMPIGKYLIILFRGATYWRLYSPRAGDNGALIVPN